jgi:Annexin
MAKCEAKALGNATKCAGSGKMIQNEEVIRILTTRSKHHLKAIFKNYKELHGKPIEEVCIKFLGVSGSVLETPNLILGLSSLVGKYFSLKLKRLVLQDFGLVLEISNLFLERVSGLVQF